MDTDLELLGKWRDGDKPAGEELFRRHFADVFRFFDNKVWSHAEDLTQQTFLECVGARDRFRAESSFRTYLFAIAWNQLRRHFQRELKVEAVDLDVSSINQLAAQMTSPSSHVDRGQRRQLIHEALAQLPVAQQTLLEYHYWHELDAAALAEIFEVPAGTIRVRLLRARNALREQIERLQAADASFEVDASDPLTASLSGPDDPDVTRSAP